MPSRFSCASRFFFVTSRHAVYPQNVRYIPPTISNIMVLSFRGCPCYLFFLSRLVLRFWGLFEYDNAGCLAVSVVSALHHAIKLQVIAPAKVAPFGYYVFFYRALCQGCALTYLINTIVAAMDAYNPARPPRRLKIVSGRFLVGEAIKELSCVVLECPPSIPAKRSRARPCGALVVYAVMLTPDVAWRQIHIVVYSTVLGSRCLRFCGSDCHLVLLVSVAVHGA